MEFGNRQGSKKYIHILHTFQIANQGLDYVLNILHII